MLNDVTYFFPQTCSGSVHFIFCFSSTTDRHQVWAPQDTFILLHDLWSYTLASRSWRGGTVGGGGYSWEPHYHSSIGTSSNDWTIHGSDWDPCKYVSLNHTKCVLNINYSLANCSSIWDLLNPTEHGRECVTKEMSECKETVIFTNYSQNLLLLQILHIFTKTYNRVNTLLVAL